MREIDEAVRQDDTKEFFQKYGLPLGAGVTLLLVGLFGYWWWDSTTEAALEVQSETIISAFDSADVRDFAGADEKAGGLIEDGAIGARAFGRPCGHFGRRCDRLGRVSHGFSLGARGAREQDMLAFITRYDRRTGASSHRKAGRA